MSESYRKLLADAAKLAECREARRAWARRAGEEWRRAQHAMDERLTEAVAQLSEEEFKRLAKAEFAKVDALMAPLLAAADKDLWPRELYRSGI